MFKDIFRDMSHATKNPPRLGTVDWWHQPLPLFDVLVSDLFFKHTEDL